MNNLNPMQLLGMLKNGNPQDVAKQIIKQNFSSDPLMQNLLKMAESGNEQGVQQFAMNFFNSQGTSLDTELSKLKKALESN